MKIVVLDGYTENPGDLSWEELEKFGEVTVYDRTSYEDSPLIAQRLKDAEIAVVNKTPVTRATIDQCPGLKLIAVLATGYNVVDCAYAKEKEISVVNVPTYGTQIVGQYAVGLLLEICSHYGHHAQTVREGKWEKNPDWCYWDFPMIELYGKTAGIIGLGRIGQATAKILTNYIQEKRIEEASCLIRGGLPINQAAEQVGFNNYSYFYKTFKKIIGCNPTDYQARY